MPISLRLLLEGEFPNEQELQVMKSVMDGEQPASKKLLASGMNKAGLKTLYDLVLWGLKTGLIKDEPLPKVKDHAMTDPKKFYEGYPEWLKYLGGLVSGYSDGEIDRELRINKDQQAFYHKKIAIEFHLHPSKARLIRFAFQVLNPVSGPKQFKGDWRPWTKSTTSLMRIPQTMTGSKIDPNATVTKETTLAKALELLGLEKKDIPAAKRKSERGSIWNRSHESLYHMLEMAKDRRDAEIRRLHPIANRHPETPDQKKQIETANKQLAVVNGAWNRVRALFARNGYALPGDENLLTSLKPKVYIPGSGAYAQR